ncbi:hypothetical protein ACFLXC_04190 [Chloroflexota bacterium]
MANSRWLKARRILVVLVVGMMLLGLVYSRLGNTLASVLWIPTTR